jgi:dipeptidyl aminopeptidase/acylaminoacyl peptidase
VSQAWQVLASFRFSDASLKGMRQSYRPFAVILALAIFAPRNAQSCCAASQAGRIAYVSRQSSVNQIYLMDVDGSGVGANPARLTNDEEAENYPSWSPDGKRLVYQREFNGSAIYAINADGSGQQRLSPTPGFDVTPSWSPDGTKIIYARLYQALNPTCRP